MKVENAQLILGVRQILRVTGTRYSHIDGFLSTRADQQVPILTKLMRLWHRETAVEGEWTGGRQVGFVPLTALSTFPSRIMAAFAKRDP